MSTLRDFVEVLYGQAGDGHTHQGVGQCQVEDEAPALAVLLQEQLQQSDRHQQVGGDDEASGQAQDGTHHPGPCVALEVQLDGVHAVRSHPH